MAKKKAKPVKKKDINVKRQLRAKIEVIEAIKAKQVNYLKIWLFDDGVEIDNPFDQKESTNSIRERLREVRAMNFKIASLKELIENEE